MVRVCGAPRGVEDSTNGVSSDGEVGVVTVDGDAAADVEAVVGGDDDAGGGVPVHELGGDGAGAAALAVAVAEGCVELAVGGEAGDVKARGAWIRPDDNNAALRIDGKRG